MFRRIPPVLIGLLLGLALVSCVGCQTIRALSFLDNKDVTSADKTHYMEEAERMAYNHKIMAPVLYTGLGFCVGGIFLIGYLRTNTTAGIGCLMIGVGFLAWATYATRYPKETAISLGVFAVISTALLIARERAVLKARSKCAII